MSTRENYLKHKTILVNRYCNVCNKQLTKFQKTLGNQSVCPCYNYKFPKNVLTTNIEQLKSLGV